jgi:hypothetical protein
LNTPGRRTAVLGVIVIATLIVVVIAAVSFGVPREQSPVAASATPTGTAASPTTSPATSQAATPASTPTQPAATSDPSVAQYLKPEVQRWQPTGTTIVAVVHESTQRPGGGTQAGGLAFVAVPTDGTPTTRLLSAPLGNGFDISQNGALFVLAVQVNDSSSRLALWDARTNVSTWLTPLESGVILRGPTFSNDSNSVIFGKSKPDVGQGAAADLGLFRVRLSDRGVDQVHAAVRSPFFSIPIDQVSDGTIYWGRAYEGSSLEALLPSGTERAFADCANYQAWREPTPRVLVVPGGCGTGFRGAELILWHDVTGEKRTIAGSTSELFTAADWNPDGNAIVAVMSPASGAAPATLVTMEASGGQRRAIAGTDHASRVLWLRAGIAYTYAQPDASGFGTKPPYEVRITPTAGGGQRTLLTSPDPIPWLRFVSSSP